MGILQILLVLKLLLESLDKLIDRAMDLCAYRLDEGVLVGVDDLCMHHMRFLRSPESEF
jgi:hypothetical protein